VSLVMTRTVFALVAAPLLATPPHVAAQGPSLPDRAIETTERRTVIDGVLARLREAYVFPDTAASMERALRERQQRGDYDRITSAQVFAESLTAHLQAVSKDRHLRVRYSAEPLPVGHRGHGPSPEELRQAMAVGRLVNFGFERVERLSGNVGYVELRSFGFEPDMVEAAAAAAMTFIGNTDALIIDVRRNGGGSPFMVAFVSSYLFGPDSVHLNSLYWRPGNRTEHFWTRARVPGTRYGPERPVYVLTSRRTFSGAEEFAYNLQTRKRAAIIGDTTGGGAHPGGMQRVTDHFGVWVPSGRAINPITQTNWEGTGVRPDVAVPAEQALKTAHLGALRVLREQATDPARRRQLEEAIAEVEGRP